MKNSIWISVALIAGLLVIGSVLLKIRPAKPQSPVGSEPLTPEVSVEPVNTPPVAAAQVVAGTQPSAVGSPSAVPLLSGSGDGGAMFRIKPGAVLATVNSVPIELKDLLPLPPGKETAEQIIPADRYAFLLDRAVDREVILQHARAQRVGLTELQRQQLAGLRARTERSPANLFDDLQHNPANADFEARDATALLLQASLAEKAGVPSRDITAAQVENYYQQHPAEFAPLPSDSNQRQAAWASIEQNIRVKLARHAQAQHDESFQKYFDQLRASAQVVKTKPNSSDRIPNYPRG